MRALIAATALPVLMFALAHAGRAAGPNTRTPAIPRAQRLFRETVWSPAANARSRELMADCDGASRLGEIDVPTLILSGRHDFFCPPSQAERMRRGIRGSELVVFEQSGHYPFVEEAEAFRHAVRGWLARMR